MQVKTNKKLLAETKSRALSGLLKYKNKRINVQADNIKGLAAKGLVPYLLTTRALTLTSLETMEGSDQLPEPTSKSPRSISNSVSKMRLPASS